LNIFDRAGDEDGEVSCHPLSPVFRANDQVAAMTLPALRRQIGKFERSVGKNAEQRGKYPDDPSK
jgi:beta-catenin-like protein 1